MHTVCETPSFLRDASEIGLSEEERNAIVDEVAANPGAGDVIPGTNGLRKRRFAGSGRGKRGGVRVIIAFGRATLPAYLVTAYAKGAKVDLSPAEKKAAARFMQEIK